MAIHEATDELIEFLNSLAKIDPYAMAEILCIRVPCNKALADHPTVQVAAGGERSGYTYIAPGTWRVGILGILNGFCGNLGGDGPRASWGPISAHYADGKLVGFSRTSPEAPPAKVEPQ